MPKVLAAGPTEFTIEFSEFIELSIETPAVPIDADDPAPDAKLVAEPVPDVRAVDDEVRLDTVDSGKVDDDVDVVVDAVVAATPDSALGAAAAELSGVLVSAELSGVDAIVVSGATVCELVPAGVAAAWTTARACPKMPPKLVVGAGTVNGLSTDAACAAA